MSGGAVLAVGVPAAGVAAVVIWEMLPEPTKNEIRGWVRGAWASTEGAVLRAKAAARGIERSIAASGRLLIRGADSTGRALQRSTDTVRGLWDRFRWAGI